MSTPRTYTVVLTEAQRSMLFDALESYRELELNCGETPDEADLDGLGITREEFDGRAALLETVAASLGDAQLT